MFTKRVYQPPQKSGKPKRKTRVIPDQSMSIQEIVDRYVRGIPVDVVRRQPIFVDQDEHDLEKISRMDFGEKAELAQQLRAEAESIEGAFQAAATAREAKQKEARENYEAARSKHTGIGPLDNTMPNDTTKVTK